MPELTLPFSIGRALYNVYENKASIKALQKLFSNVFKNNKMITHGLLLSFNKLLMTKHITSHRLQNRKFEGSQDDVNRHVGPSNLEIDYSSTKHNPFARDFLSVRSSPASDGAISLALPYKSMFTGNFVTPCLHGGITAALISHSVECCAKAYTGCTDVSVYILNLRFDYLAPAPCFENIYCDAIVSSSLENRLVVDVICWNRSRTVKLVLGRSHCMIHGITQVNLKH